MNTVEPGSLRSDVLGLWAYRKTWDSRQATPPREERAGTADEAGAESTGKEQKNKKDFSEQDLDILLRKCGVESTPRHRQTALFLLQHRLEIRPEIFQLAARIFPEGMRSSAKADAFIAAMSKLPIEAVAEGSGIILSTMTGEHLSAISTLQQLRVLLMDLVSESYSLTDMAVAPEFLRAALEEEISVIEGMLKLDLKGQIALLVDRKELIRIFHRIMRFADNLELLLLGKTGRKDEYLTRLFQQFRAACRQGVNLLLTDAILSREDIHHHLTDEGARYSLGLALGHYPQPCRMWIHDRQNPSARELDASDIVLFFRWYTEELGTLESTVKIEDTALEISFATPHYSVKFLLDQERRRIEERLSALGFEAVQSPTLTKLSSDKAENEVAIRGEDKMGHLDTEA